MRYGLIVVALMFASCGDQEVKRETVTVMKDKEPSYDNVSEKVRPHLAEFLQYCKMTKYADKCKINMQMLTEIVLKKKVDAKDPNIIGVCRTYSSGYRKIELASEYYELESLEFKILVWHELGHCLMELPHVDDRLHIMNSWMMDYADLFENWEWLMKDFLYGETDEKLSSCSLRHSD